MVRLTLIAAAVTAALAVLSPVAGSADGKDAAEVPHKCPISEKCPYYEHAKDTGMIKSSDDKTATKGCPLKEKGCPYYEKHKGDHNLVDALVTENDDCPLASKCKFYQDVKDGTASAVNFNKSDCPLAHKCPYYDELKKNGSTTATDCPVLHACPHFSKKDLETQPHVGGHPHGHAHKGHECPFIAKKKAEEALEAEKVHVKDEL
ncbi:uncharacterized protein SPPG_08063 [Spizellomyces punctatus DAOM BR117]|uniref:Uncharacterized protein n=1 Tax=Spizellomyces punctatus (strain DAOM BR117) TaxID=645134 RepID=A0A0L0H5H7_SPIPD|nr:uncharacterized protein SPPG_08063 [Spizellomyces punctatus DAOM BR117]KNC96472.1 hypothetical protein SPPG_08063 [Spizellomyces punctatus DAOM BR117]|eukprot:XP_016604512.1 hypothetical protein SPPG_08063 [Spizellomyces punctatus DAOM BR117]